MMQPIKIVLIVEGEGEVSAAPSLIHRIARHYELDQQYNVICPRPINLKGKGRFHNSKLDYEKSLKLAKFHIGEEKGAILVLLDADDDCPRQLAEGLLERTRSEGMDVPFGVVVANSEYETWFIAAFASLVEAPEAGFKQPSEYLENPEEKRGAKEWLSKHRKSGDPYKPTLHQNKLTKLFSLDAAFQNSRSFRKLCKEIRCIIEQVASS
jgi:hypothetical protein